MAKCKECIHVEVCKTNPVITAFSPENEAYCGAFKSREDFVPVKHGRWIATPVYKVNRTGRSIRYCDYYHCSECGTQRPIVPPDNYCPNCGAHMDLEVKDDT